MKRFTLIVLSLKVSFVITQPAIDDYFKLIDYGYSRCDSIVLEDYCESISNFKKGQYDSCFIASQKILTVNTLLKKDKNLLNYINGVSLQKKGLYLKAIEKFNLISKGFEFNHLLNYKYAESFLALKQYDTVISIYNRWLKANPKGLNLTELKAVYHNLASAYLFKERYDLAEEFFIKRLKFALEEKDTLSIIRVENELGNLFNNQDRYNLAIPYFKRAYDLAQKFPDIQLKENTAYNLAVIEESAGNYHKSVDYYKQYTVWNDSLWNRDRISELLEKDKQQALAIKEKEVHYEKTAKQAQRQQRNWFMASTLLFLILAIGIFYLYKTSQRQKLQLRQLNNLKNFLFSVVSHDMRSNVYSLYQNNTTIVEALDGGNAKTALEQAQTNQKVSYNTLHLLNNTLNWTLTENNQLDYLPQTYNLKRLLDAWIYDIMPRANQNNIEVKNLVSPKSYVFVDKELLKIVFRNLLDNALKYMPNAGRITLEATEIKGFCELNIADTGPGMPSALLEHLQLEEDLSLEKVNRAKGVGLGLVLCRRLMLINKGRIHFKNNKEPSGLVVSLQLPLSQTA